MGVKRTFIAGIVFLLALGLYVQDRGRLTREEEERSRAARLLPAPIDDVTSLRITRSASLLDLRRAEDGWEIIRPLQTQADPQTLHDLLFYLDKQQVTAGEESSEAALRDYGLDAPALRLAVGLKGAEPAFTLLVGAEAPVKGEVYARLPESNRAFTIAADLRGQFLRPLYDFRDKALLDVNATEATTLSLTAEGSTIEVVKGEQGWTITRPTAMAADSAYVESILRELQSTRAVDFIDTDTLELDQYGLAANPLVAMVEAPAGEAARRSALLVGRRRTPAGQAEPAYYAMRLGRDQVFTIPQRLESELRSTVNELRSKTIFTLAADDVTSMTLEFGAGRVALGREAGGAWKFADDPGRGVDQEFASQTLAHILKIKASGFFDVNPLPDQAGLEAPLLRIALADAAGDRIEGIETGVSTRGREAVYARKLKGREIFTIPAGVPGQFFLTPQDFEEKSLFQFDPKTLARVEIADSRRKLAVFQEGDQWYGRHPETGERFQVRPTDVETMALNVLRLKWQRRLNPSDESDHILIQTMKMDQPASTIQLFNAAGEELAYLGQCGDDGKRVYLRLHGEGQYYEIGIKDYLRFLASFKPVVMPQ